MCARIIFAREKEENIARQQSPIIKEMFVGLLELAKHSHPNSLKAIVADWMTFVRITGLCCTEYAQKTQSVVDEHICPLGKKFVEAFLPTDWIFYDHNSATTDCHPLNSELQDFPKKGSHVLNTKKKPAK